VNDGVRLRIESVILMFKMPLYFRHFFLFFLFSGRYRTKTRANVFGAAMLDRVLLFCEFCQFVSIPFQMHLKVDLGQRQHGQLCLGAASRFDHQ
jgi:hypothetical protein